MILNRRQATGLMIAGAAANAFPMRMPAFAASDGDAHRSHGASLVGNVLVARIRAASGFQLRRRLVPVLSGLADGPLPLVWSL